jgi:hypothetical protein
MRPEQRGAVAELYTRGVARSAERSFLAPVAAAAREGQEAPLDAVSQREFVAPAKS